MTNPARVSLISAITDFPQLQKISEPEDKLPRIKVNGVAKISAQVKDFGLQVAVNNRIFRLRYPSTIWNRFPKTHRKILSQNIAFSMTYHLPYLYTSLKKMQYNLPVPLSEAFFYKGFSQALPSTAVMQDDEKARMTSNLLRRLYDVEYVYSNKKTDIPPYNRTSFEDCAVMPFTFGKDSLLTFAIARDMGLTIYPIFIAEPYSPYEEVIKKILAEPFKKEFRTQISFLRNRLGILREPDDGWFGWEMQLTQYSLMLLPYVYARRAGYILFSNEQSCNDTVVDEDGFKYNPVFEQSHSWLLQNSLMTSIIGGNSLSIGSILEPIHEIAIERILHKRYPSIAKYQSSCDLPHKPESQRRWCESCSKCARMYIFMLANGINPNTVGFKRNLLRDKYHCLYTIFNSNKVKDFGYDQSQAGKDEQILAFLMAYRNNHKGPVMKSFARKYLSYARKNEKRLRLKYFGIHSTKTIPQELKTRVVNIYRHELRKMV
ncbi:hypothetical protein A2W14_07300 [Candidatus Gottesmanbacteria bacterium RBG_16_37_8]|uniref:Uncharacterized protein n=1 Tax=Candidatus Gottesmanbacteria bacterium RBG_16_37_8 TaxID=1798371 RepID=A0A1F5YPK7_9BACT|nr:MAG: hypothetical protein A2W14_07300 [Candidatus Gottesmanbacteria bacterium RBG_16_37_8]